MVASNKASKPPIQQQLPTATGQPSLERLGLLATSDAVPEPLVTFAELARRLATSTGRRRVAVSTIHRWRSPGIRGRKLASVRIGGRWFTTESWFAAFCDATTEPDHSVAALSRISSSVGKALAAEGF